GGPGVAFEAAKGGGDGADGGEAEPALLADPDGAGETDGEVAEADIGEGFALTTSSTSIGGPSGDLDIITSGGAVYDEAKELNPGGWVAVNNDNDNYNFDPNNPLNHTYDKDENTKVDRENDLVGIKITAAAPHPTKPGKFTLEWNGNGTRINVFRSADKDLGALPSGVEVAAGKTYYVEGLTMSGTARDTTITLGWVDKATNVRAEVDGVLFTVYGVRGPMNVPGYSNHTYSVQTPDPRTSAIDTVVNGKADPTTLVDPATYTTSRKILWDGGPALGKYKATPVVGEPFWSDREVNVVQVQFGFANPWNELKTNNTAVEQWTDLVGQPENYKGVYSSHVDAKTDARRAMTATLEVLSIVGPLVDVPTPHRRGIRFIDAGLIQVARFTHMHGDFNHSAPPFRRVANAEGKSFLDATPADRPWYSVDEGYYRGSPNDGVSSGRRLTLRDNPRFPATDVLTVVPTSKALQLVDGSTATPLQKYSDQSAYDDVDFFSIVADFDVYVAAHTVETENQADEQYTVRGQGVWQFNGSGNVAVAAGKNAADKTLPLAERHVWTKQVANPNTTGGAGATTSTFSEVTDGRVVSPAYTGLTSTLANDAIQTSPPLTWASQKQ
ncbi:MAG: hypothetical protein K2X82_30080, partial [Gemmataceae bacterium]|nr:hypothetical protein [Gemmataceae bacterium]